MRQRSFIVISLLTLVCFARGETTFKDSTIIRFDNVPGASDVDKIKRLPELIRSKLQTIGTKYSLDGGWPQPGYLYTTVRIVFSARVYDFRHLKAPVDMGHCFEFIGQGRPIFECGKNGFIRFAQRKTLIKDIAFVGPRDNVPPLIIYATGEAKDWRPEGGKAQKDEPKAWGKEADAGDIRILGCYFKGFGVVLRCQPGQHTCPTYCRIADCTFYNCVQLSDNLVFDWCVIENSWFCPTFRSDKAFIVTRDTLMLRDILAVPQSDTGKLKNLRWIDNYGAALDIRHCRWGNEYVNKHDPLSGEQVSLVYNYTKFRTRWINPDKTVEMDMDRNYIIIKDNCLYARNVPVIKFFAIPNHVIITGNTGLIGWYKKLREEKEYDTSVLCEFDKRMKLPGMEMKPFITFNIADSNRALKITADDPDFLPYPLCYFGPEKRGTKEREKDEINKTQKFYTH